MKTQTNYWNARLVALVLALLLTGCGSSSKDSDFFQEEVEPKKPKVSAARNVTQNWRVNVGVSASSLGAEISPALLGEHLYAAAANGRIVKVNASNGRELWAQRLKGETITSGVGVGGGLVLVGTSEGEVVALNQTNGAEAWRAKLSSEILARPVIDADVVVARSADGRVYGLAAYDGDVLWTISRELPRLTLRGDSEPLLFQGAVFAGFADGTLAALEAKTGRALWDFPIAFPRGTNEIDR